MPANWDRVQKLFLEASDLRPDERAAFLDRECGGDAELRREVESLLAHDNTGEQVIAGALRDAAQSLLDGTRLKPGTRLGEYEIHDLIGSGGMGEVYRARDLKLNRDVAIKLLTPYTGREDRTRRFAQEAQAAAALNHPNIVSVYQFGEYAGKPFLVTELLSGETLRESLHGGPLPTRTAVDFGAQIARGLAAAHEKGMVHRDVKPENVFVTKSGAVKILDFGLAKPVRFAGASADGRIATQPGLAAGTVGYMSPEQVRGEETDHRTDVFAFGALLYEMLSGRAAFKKASFAETSSAILNEHPTPISQTGVLPIALQRIVDRCLEKNPEKRFQSASDLAFALEALSESGTHPSAVADVSRSRLAPWLVIVPLIVGVALAVWWFTPPTPARVLAVRQLTDDGDPKAISIDAASGALASDASRLYFNEKHEGNWRIAQVAAAGGPSAPVATTVRNPILAGINTDATLLLTLNGWLLPVPAGPPRQIGDLPKLTITSSTYFPDGHHIAYATGGTIYVTDANGNGTTRKIWQSSGEVRWLSVSPDGQRIRFTLLTETDEGLREVSASGGTEREVLPGWHGVDYACCGQWTRDGREYVFLREHHGSFDLWARHEVGTWFDRTPATPVQLTNGPLSYFEPLPGPEKNTIFAVGAKRKGELVRYDAKRGDFVSYLDGISATDAVTSADGQWIAYLSYPDSMLWRRRSDGSEPLQLGAIKSFFPCIAPDGTRVAFIAYEPGKGLGAYIVNMAGGAPHRVLERAIWVAWSPDGRSLVYQENSPVAAHDALLHTLELESGFVREIPDSQAMFSPVWPAPQTILAVKEGDLQVFDLARSRWTSLVKDIDNYAVSGENVFVEKEAGGTRKAYRLSLKGGKLEESADLTRIKRVEQFGPGTWMGVSHDGSVLVTRDLSTQEIYALDVKW